MTGCWFISCSLFYFTRNLCYYYLSSIEVDFESPSKGRKLLPVGAILGIVAAVALVIISILGILWWQGCLGRKNTLHQGNLTVEINLIAELTLISVGMLKD